MYTCPICGSREVVWDEYRGEIICSSCGTVIDQIYYTPKTSLEISLERGETEKQKKIRRSLERPGKIIKTYNKLFASWSLRKGLEINIESLNSLREGVYNGHVFKYYKDPLLEKMLEISPTLKKIYDYTSMFPRLASRTFRARLLISYIVLKEASRSLISNSLMSKAFSVSKNHLNRVRKELKKYPEIHKLVYSLEINSKEIEELDQYLLKLAGSSINNIERSSHAKFSAKEEI